MLETKERDIDGMKVNVTQFPARYGFKLQAKLAKIFGPVIGELFSGVKGNVKNFTESDLDMSKISDAIRVLFEKLDENSAETLVFELTKSTKVDGTDIDDKSFDLIFPGKYASLYKIIFFVLEVNYGSFFGLRGIGEAIKKFQTTNTPVSQQS